MRLIVLIIFGILFSTNVKAQCKPVSVSCNYQGCGADIRYLDLDYLPAHTIGYDYNLQTVARSEPLISVISKEGSPAYGIRKVVSAQFINLIEGDFVPPIGDHPEYKNVLDFAIGDCYESGVSIRKDGLKKAIIRNESKRIKNRIYPNPIVDGVFRINTSDDVIKIEVYNILGNLIRSITPINQETVRVDMGEESNGMYMVKISTKSITETSKIMISR